MTYSSAPGIALDDRWSYRLVAEAVPNLVFLAAADRGIEYANRAYLDFTGQSPEGVVHRDWLASVHPGDKAAALAAWNESHRSEQPLELKLRLRRIDGAHRWHLLRFVPLRQPGEAPRGWLGSATDIDDYQRAEEVRQFFATSMQSLTASLNYNQVLRTLADLLVPEWADICVVDVLGPQRNVEHSEVACADPGQVDVVQSLRVSNWLAGPNRSETVAQVILRGGEVFVPHVSRDWLTQIAPPDEVEKVKTLHPLSAICVPLRGRNRTLGALALVTTATSERRYTEREAVLARNLANRAGVILDNARLYAASRRVAEELKQANRAKDEFLGLMSHELRTPITTIWGNAQVLKRLIGQLDREAIAGALEDIKHDSERLHLMIENLLALARDADDRAGEAEPILMARVLKRLKEAHERSYPGRNLQLRLKDIDACAVANPSFLELVIRNLLNNAEKYSPATQPIDLGLEVRDGEAIVTVRDRGPGISPEESAHVFQPFFRSRNIREIVPGVGIGLTVCKRLVEAQSGRIWVWERFKGGTAVSFALPLETAS